MGRGARREASRLFCLGEGVAGVGSGGHWMDGRRAAWLPHLGWDQLYTKREGWKESNLAALILGGISCTETGDGWKESSLTALFWVGSAVHRRGRVEGEQPCCPILGGISCTETGDGWKESSLTALFWVGSAVHRRGRVEGEQPGCPILGGISCTQKGRSGCLEHPVRPTLAGVRRATGREGEGVGRGEGENIPSVLPCWGV